MESLTGLLQLLEFENNIPMASVLCLYLTGVKDSSGNVMQVNQKQAPSYVIARDITSQYVTANHVTDKHVP
jgi:hypothetical protein